MSTRKLIKEWKGKVSRTSVRRIVAQQEKTTAALQRGVRAKLTRVKKPRAPDTEAKVLEWMDQVRQAALPVSEEIVKVNL
jgi:hypothetical protein